MAICLDVAHYCDECDGFEPKVIKNDVSSLNGTHYTETTIQCENKKKCSRMYFHAKQFVEREYRNGLNNKGDS